MHVQNMNTELSAVKIERLVYGNSTCNHSKTVADEVSNEWHGKQ